MIWLAVAGGLVAVGALGPIVASWRPGPTAGPRARARSAHARLSSELALTAVPDDADRQVLLAQAQERFTTSGGLLARARTRRQCLLAEQVALDGLALLARAAG